MSAQALTRYAMVGALATAVHYALLVGAVEWAHWPPAASAAAGAVVGAQVAYVGNRWFTFAHRGDARRSWARFQLTAVLGAMTSGLTVLGAQALGWHYLVGQLAATGLSMGLTFEINRRWAFAKGSLPDAPPLRQDRR